MTNADRTKVGDRYGIYIASKTKHADRWRSLRDRSGYPIISTWIDEAGEGESQDLADLWRRCIHEASHAQALILYREAEEVLKGGWIELGAALASGVKVFAVGIDEFTVAHDSRIEHVADMKSAIAGARSYLAALSQSQPAPMWEGGKGGLNVAALTAAIKALEEFEGGIDVHSDAGSRAALVVRAYIEALTPAPQPDAKASGVEGRGLARHERKYPFGRTIAEMDIEAFLNIRQWLNDAVTQAGAVVEGRGIGLGMATLCLQLDGMRYDVTITPLESGGVAAPTPPTEAGVEEPEVKRYTHAYFSGVYSGMTKHAKGEWVRLSDHNTIVERLKRERNEEAHYRWHEQRLKVEAIDSFRTERERSDRLREAAQRVYDKLAHETASVTIFDQEELGAALRELKGGE